MVYDYSRHETTLENDPKDRHVVAAAIEAEAEVIVTRNVKHFAPLPDHLIALVPDDFLCHFLGNDDVLLECFENVRMRWPTPPSREYLLNKFRGFAPTLVNELSRTIAAS